MNYKRLESKLNKRKEATLYRELPLDQRLVDFSSNNYLGLAQANSQKNNCDGQSGSTGSRLLTGNSSRFESIERDIARRLGGEAGLVYNSGYDANIGLLSSVLLRNDLVLYDELCHASIIDGINLGFAKSLKFKHNDMSHLEQLLLNNKGETVYVIVESLYSMDGDAAPLKKMVEFCRVFDANLIVDEAHATGIYGEAGKGLVAEAGIEAECFARVHTFGKAIGVHGAIVIGSSFLRSYLINFSRPFIFTTALPLSVLENVKSSFELVTKELIGNLWTKISLFNQTAKFLNIPGVSFNESPIQYVMIAGNDRARQLSSNLQEDNFNVRPILSPTVKKGAERLRICLHAFNTEDEIQSLLHSIKKYV